MDFAAAAVDRRHRRRLLGDPRPAFDVLGPEIGLAGNKQVRYRGFLLVDRLKLDGFEPTSPGAWRSAVVHRQDLQ
jgi:hypothetical protein